MLKSHLDESMQIAKVRKGRALTRTKGQQMDNCSGSLLNEDIIYFRNPTPLDSKKDLVSTTWQPVTSTDNLEYLHIESPSNIYMNSGLLKDRVVFWSSLPLGFTNTAHTLLRDEL
jgi:hypothetical protein